MRARGFDFKLVAMLVVLIVTVTACWGFFQRNRQLEALADSARQSGTLAERTAADLAATRRELDRQAAQAKTQRHALRRQNRQLQAQVDALVDYFRSHGLAVPRAVYSPRSGGSGGGGGSGPSKRPSESVAPVPERPGKSSAHANPHAANPRRP